MSCGRQRTTAGKRPATSMTHSRQPLRILVVEIHPPHWGHTCHKICEALENVFCLACSLAGSPRIPSFSLYVAQNQQECLLPFVPIKGGFTQLQNSISELHALPAEGVFQPKEDAVVQAVQDGLRQFKQYTGQGMAGASLSHSSVEITVLTSKPSRQMAQLLDTGLQGIDLVGLRQLQVVEVFQREFHDKTDAEGAVSSGSTTVLNTDVDLQTVENDVVALEDFFKTWLHDYGPDQEHLHLLLPAGPISSSASLTANPAHVKCDVQERFLNPAQLSAACDGETAGMDTTPHPFWTAPGLPMRKLRVLRALKADGVCASLLFGLPLVLRPTSCWQLSWEELEANQQSFQALCHCLWKREWLLLAKGESYEGTDAKAWANTYQVLLPSGSSSLLLRSVVARELLLPFGLPVLPEPPEAVLAKMEDLLNSLEVEDSYNPLQKTSHLYKALRSSLGHLQACWPQHWAKRQGPRQHSGRSHLSKARITVAPLQVAPPRAGSSKGGPQSRLHRACLPPCFLASPSGKGKAKLRGVPGQMAPGPPLREAALTPHVRIPGGQQGLNGYTQAGPGLPTASPPFHQT